EVFEMWIGEGARRLAAGGVPHAAARRLAIEMLALLEGAFVLCRAARDTEALAVAADTAVASLSAALAPGAPVPDTAHAGSVALAPGMPGPDDARAGGQQRGG